MRVRERRRGRRSRHGVQCSSKTSAGDVLAVDFRDRRVDHTPAGFSLCGADFMLRMEFIVVLVEDWDVLVEEVRCCCQRMGRGDVYAVVMRVVVGFRLRGCGGWVL